MSAARLRRATTGDADLATIATLTNAITPDDPTSVDEMRWSDATYPPGSARFLAELDGRAVGVASVGRVHVKPPEHADFWAYLAVVPESRRQGIGETLLVAICTAARDAGKTGLTLRVSGARPESAAFLEHRGFTERSRAAMVRLALEGLEPPAIVPPAGIVITDLATRPDLVPGIHAVALEAFADIPADDEPMAVGDLAEFRARDVDRPGIPADAFAVALDAASDEVVGYASLILQPGSTTVAWHDMTAVRRAWRGRGIAGALKRATIAWACAHGLTALETGNDLENAPMRAVNRQLGYRPIPDDITFRGPLFLPDTSSRRSRVNGGA